MNKGIHFSGQPVYGQLISLLDKQKILRFSRKYGGERYVKHFDAWQHLVIMLYAVIKRYSFCENPEKDWAKILGTLSILPPEPSFFN